MKSFLFVVAALALVVFLVAGPPEVAEAAAETCDKKALIKACKPAFKSPKVKPTKKCCKKMQEQEECLCNYFKKDDLFGKSFFTKENAERVSEACGLTFPQCD